MTYGGLQRLLRVYTDSMDCSPLSVVVLLLATVLDVKTSRHPFNGFSSRTTWVSQVKLFWIFMKQEMTGGSGIRWTMM